MDKLADSRIDIETVSTTLVSTTLATDQTTPDFDDDELEKELDSLLYQNDTENISDMFGGLTVDTIPPTETTTVPSDEPSASLDVSIPKL